MACMDRWKFSGLVLGKVVGLLGGVFVGNIEVGSGGVVAVLVDLKNKGQLCLFQGHLHLSLRAETALLYNGGHEIFFITIET